MGSNKTAKGREVILKVLDINLEKSGTRSCYFVRLLTFDFGWNQISKPMHQIETALKG